MQSKYVNLIEADEKARQENALYIALTGDMSLSDEFADRRLYRDLFTLSCIDKSLTEQVLAYDIAHRYASDAVGHEDLHELATEIQTLRERISDQSIPFKNQSIKSLSYAYVREDENKVISTCYEMGLIDLRGTSAVKRVINASSMSNMAFSQDLYERVGKLKSLDPAKLGSLASKSSEAIKNAINTNNLRILTAALFSKAKEIATQPLSITKLITGDKSKYQAEKLAAILDFIDIAQTLATDRAKSRILSVSEINLLQIGAIEMLQKSGFDDVDVKQLSEIKDEIVSAPGKRNDKLYEAFATSLRSVRSSHLIKVISPNRGLYLDKGRTEMHALLHDYLLNIKGKNIRELMIATISSRYIQYKSGDVKAGELYYVINKIGELEGVDIDVEKVFVLAMAKASDFDLDSLIEISGNQPVRVQNLIGIESRFKAAFSAIKGFSDVVLESISKLIGTFVFNEDRKINSTIDETVKEFTKQFSGITDKLIDYKFKVLTAGKGNLLDGLHYNYRRDEVGRALLGFSLILKGTGAEIENTTLVSLFDDIKNNIDMRCSAAAAQLSDIANQYVRKFSSDQGEQEKLADPVKFVQNFKM